MVRKPTAPAPTRRAPVKKDVARDFKTVMARMNRAGWQEFKKLSTDLDESMEDLIIQALNDLLIRHGRKAAIEKRKRPKDE
jgi:hypothetical protein